MNNNGNGGRHCSPRGMALAAILVIMMIILLLAVSLVAMTTNQARYSLKRSNEAVTMQAALAGLNELEYALAPIDDWGGQPSDLFEKILENLQPQYTEDADRPGPGGPEPLTIEWPMRNIGCYYSVTILSDNYTQTHCEVLCRGYFKESGGNRIWEKKLKGVFTKESSSTVIYTGPQCTRIDVRSIYLYGDVTLYLGLAPPCGFLHGSAIPHGFFCPACGGLSPSGGGVSPSLTFDSVRPMPGPEGHYVNCANDGILGQIVISSSQGLEKRVETDLSYPRLSALPDPDKVDKTGALSTAMFQPGHDYDALPVIVCNTAYISGVTVRATIIAAGDVTVIYGGKVIGDIFSHGNIIITQNGVLQGSAVLRADDSSKRLEVSQYGSAGGSGKVLFSTGVVEIHNWAEVEGTVLGKYKVGISNFAHVVGKIGAYSELVVFNNASVEPAGGPEPGLQKVYWEVK